MVSPAIGRGHMATSMSPPARSPLLQMAAIRDNWAARPEILTTSHPTGPDDTTLSQSIGWHQGDCFWVWYA
jgi:hypothetical protein